MATGMDATTIRVSVSLPLKIMEKIDQYAEKYAQDRPDAVKTILKLFTDQADFLNRR